jgi:hypothetical protein
MPNIAIVSGEGGIHHDEETCRIRYCDLHRVHAPGVGNLRGETERSRALSQQEIADVEAYVIRLNGIRRVK